MSFDVTALNPFRNASLGGENAIANLGEGNKIVKKNGLQATLTPLFAISVERGAGVV